MRVTGLNLTKIKIPLKNKVIHYLRSYIFSESIIVKVTTNEGVTGWGEARPREYLTGETFESLKATIKNFAVGYFAGKEFTDFSEARKCLNEGIPVSRNMLAAYCGLELAVLDAAGKFFCCHVGEMMGNNGGAEYVEAANIGFQTKTSDLRKICLAIRIGGFQAAKIKAGQKDDLERIKLIRKFIGDDFLLWIDANGAWDFDSARRMINQIKAYNINMFEQPLPASEIKSMAKLRGKTKVKLIADESLCSMEDGLLLIKEKACDIFNIRIGKCGGIQKTLDLIALAAEHQIEYHIGSLVAETGILLQPLKLLIQRINRVGIVEGLRQNKTLLADDIVEGDYPHGLGIRINEAKLHKYADQTTEINLEAKPI